MVIGILSVICRLSSLFKIQLVFGTPPKSPSEGKIVLFNKICHKNWIPFKNHGARFGSWWFLSNDTLRSKIRQEKLKKYCLHRFTKPKPLNALWRINMYFMKARTSKNLHLAGYFILEEVITTSNTKFSLIFIIIKQFSEVREDTI